MAAPRSPRPNLREPPSDLFVVDTPSTVSVSPARSLASSSSLSPSPVKIAVRSPGKEKRQRKRRESGCLQIPPREDSRSGEAVEEIAEWDEGRNIVIPPSKAVVGPKSQVSPANATIARNEQNIVEIEPETITAPEMIVSAPAPSTKISWRTKKVAESVVGVAEGVDGVVGWKGKGKTVEAIAIVEAVEAIEVEALSGK